jgi:hypothetical protein
MAFISFPSEIFEFIHHFNYFMIKDYSNVLMLGLNKNYFHKTNIILNEFVIFTFMYFFYFILLIIKFSLFLWSLLIHNIYNLIMFSQL